MPAILVFTAPAKRAACIMRNRNTLREPMHAPHRTAIAAHSCPSYDICILRGMLSAA